MPTRKSEAVWNGDLKKGQGTMTLGSGAYEGQYSYRSRFEEGTGTNPEELIGAAHAGCFSMALSNILAQAGHTPDRVHTTAAVHLEEGSITRIELRTDATVPGLDADTFREHAEEAKENCPVSKLLKPGADITLKAELTS